MSPGPLPSTSSRCVDTCQFGLPERGAAYLVGRGPYALIEAGTPRSADVLCAATKGLDLRYILVTHVHLDHAGAAGDLAREHPEARVVVHPRGAKHLIDPRRLVEGVRAASPDLFNSYGVPTPLPPERVLSVKDGETLPLGAVVLEAIHTPGHAPHHVAYLQRPDEILYPGDAAGNHGIPLDVPLTVPPRFDVEASIESLHRLRRLRPRVIAYTHFGFGTGRATAQLESYERSILRWLERIRRLRITHPEGGVVQAVLSDPAYRGLRSEDRDSIAMCVRGALRTLDAASENR